MKKAHQVLLNELQKRPHSKEELIEKTGYSYDGIRGRLSELRKLGFEISYEPIEEKKYILKSTCKERMVKYLQQNGLFDTLININTVAKQMNWKREGITIALSQLFEDDTYSITQYSSYQVRISKR